MSKSKLHEIVPGSIVKATKGGYLYCETDPPHPSAEKRKDRKKRYVYLHRAVMENKLGRYLKQNEQVDHKDGDKTNNSPSNLELIELGKHQKSHADRGNHFWKDSPKNKPQEKKASDEMVQRVILRYKGLF